MRKYLLVASAFSLAMVCSLHAQGLTSRAARPADVLTLDGIIGAFYDVVSGPANQARDWARDSTLYTSDVRFGYMVGQGAQRRWQTVTHAMYATQSGPTLRSGFFEREIHRVMRRYGNMVHVFSTYEWASPAPNGPQRGRGINSIELMFDRGRWWITYAQWVSESADNPIPAEFLPRGE
jgi:hypothetical protein